MPIHDSIQAITTAIADNSGLPAMGPSAHVLRDEGFKKGLVLTGGEFLTYGAARKVGMIMELRARGLLSTGNVSDIKDRLRRSDTNTLLSPDWGPLPATWDATSMDADSMKVSDMDYAAVCDKLKGMDVIMEDLPDDPPDAEAPRLYCLWLLRQHLAFLARSRDATAPAAASTAGGLKRKPEDEAAEVQCRTLRIQQFLLRPAQSSKRRRLLQPGSADFLPATESLVRAIVLQSIMDEKNIDTSDEMAAVVQSVLDLSEVDFASDPVSEGASSHRSGATSGESEQERRLKAILDAAERGSGALSGEAQAKMERLESRTRATAATLASVALPADQAAWRDKIMTLEVELNEAEDIALFL
jgi:hypothetical protein